MTFDEFDEATPRMVRVWVNGYIDRATQRREQLVEASWHGARFAIAASREPGLGGDDLVSALNFGKPKPKRTWQEESARWDGFFAAYRAKEKGKAVANGR